MTMLASLAAAETAGAIGALTAAEFGTAALLSELGLGSLGIGVAEAAGAGGAGGLSGLTPLLQGEFGLASLNPEIAAQVSQAANLGNALGSGTGAASMFPTESMLAQAEAAQYGGQLSPFNPAGSPVNGGEFNVLGSQGTSEIMRGVDPRMMRTLASNAGRAYEDSRQYNPLVLADAAKPLASPYDADIGFGDMPSAMAGPFPAQGGASMADMYGGPPAAPSAQPGFLDQIGEAWGKLPKSVQYGLGGIGAIKALNYLDGNKYGTPATEKYEGPLSRFKYNPDRYTPSIATPNVYRPSYAGGGLADLGDYADYAGGGRMLKGPGDGMSDSIPATIAGKQPARLANDEFVVSADVVSHLGNGSSDAGAKQLYKMMDRVRAARTGKQAQAKQINPTKYMPA
jgi:hypothetical protein